MADRVRAGLKRRLTWLAGLSPLLCAAPAGAEPFQTGGVGVFAGYAFGERGGFEWGLEGFATRYLDQPTSQCSQSERHGVGPLLRLSAVKLSRLELTLSAHGGGDLPNLRSVAALDAELGVSVLFQRGHEIAVAPHSALLAESMIFNLYFRQAWLYEQEAILPQLSFGAGARYLPTFGEPGFCSDGRPYRDASGGQQCAALRRSPGFQAREPRAQAWAKRAAEECASVPAFLQLALELLELGAPLELVTASVRAADEELGHTHAALLLAQRFGGGPVRVVAPPFRQRAQLPRRLALARIAREAWLDGCVNEGRAAARAAVEAEQSRVAEEARISKRIAHEEAGHALLSAHVMRWALAELERLPRVA